MKKDKAQQKLEKSGYSVSVLSNGLQVSLRPYDYRSSLHKNDICIALYPYRIDYFDIERIDDKTLFLSGEIFIQ